MKAWAFLKWTERVKYVGFQQSSHQTSVYWGCTKIKKEYGHFGGTGVNFKNSLFKYASKAPQDFSLHRTQQINHNNVNLRNKVHMSLFVW
jgi:hypothetical protein